MEKAEAAPEKEIKKHGNMMSVEDRGLRRRKRNSGPATREESL